MPEEVAASANNAKLQPGLQIRVKCTQIRIRPARKKPDMDPT